MEIKWTFFCFVYISSYLIKLPNNNTIFQHNRRNKSTSIAIQSTGSRILSREKYPKTEINRY